MKYLVLFLLFLTACGGGGSATKITVQKLDVNGKYSFTTSSISYTCSDSSSGKIDPLSFNLTAITTGNTIVLSGDGGTTTGITIDEADPLSGTVESDNTFVTNANVTGSITGVGKVLIHYHLSGTFTETGWSGDYNYTATGVDTVFTCEYKSTFSGTKQEETATDTTEPIVGLVAEFKFSGNANSEDGNYSGSVNGAILTKDRFGSENSAYYFDGIDDYISIPADSELTPRIFTTCMWVKAEYSSYSTIMHHGYTIRLEAPSLYGESISFSAPNHFNVDSFSYEKWVHVAVTKDDPNTQKIYLNGQLADSNDFTGSSSSVASSTIVNIGRLFAENKGRLFFRGVIDDIQIYDHPLTDEEIASLYSPVEDTTETTTTTADLDSGLVAHYAFNGDFKDSSSIKNHGNSNGAVLTADRRETANSAVLFDGSSSVFAPNGSHLNFSHMSIAFWMKCTGGGTMNLISTHYGDGWYVRFENLGDGTGYFTGTILLDGSSAPVKLNEWVHVVITNNGFQTEFYLDGVKQSGEFGGSGAQLTTDRDLFIGMHEAGALGYVGALDNIRIYDRVITEEEIQLIKGE